MRPTEASRLPAFSLLPFGDSRLLLQEIDVVTGRIGSRPKGDPRRAGYSTEVNQKSPETGGL
jgi:hypothetical protein